MNPPIDTIEHIIACGVACCIFIAIACWSATPDDWVKAFPNQRRGETGRHDRPGGK